MAAAKSFPCLFIVLASIVDVALSTVFPYDLVLTQDGPVLYDTPITINATLVPKKTFLPHEKAQLDTSQEIAKTFYFHWIDTHTPFDCPHRVTQYRNVSGLSSSYTVTYHKQILRCPPVYSHGDGRYREIGVAIFDDPNFLPEWSTPLATALTSIGLNEKLDLHVMARPCIYVVPDDPDPMGEDYFLAGWALAVNGLYSDPSKTIYNAHDQFYHWWMRPDPHGGLPPIPYNVNLGSGFMYTPDRPARYTWGVDLDFNFTMPVYPGMPSISRNISSRVSANRTFVVLERVRDLQLVTETEGATVGQKWTLKISLNGTFPIFVNWSMEFTHHGAKSRQKDPITVVGNESCLYEGRDFIPIKSENDVDLEARVCNIEVEFNFSRVGAYRVTVVGYNKVMRLNRNYVKDSKFVWVHSASERVQVTTFVLPFVFILLGVGCCVFTYTQYAHYHHLRSVEIADFEVSFSYENEAGARVRPRRSAMRWMREFSENCVNWIGSHGVCQRRTEGDDCSYHEIGEPEEKSYLDRIRNQKKPQRYRLSTFYNSEMTGYHVVAGDESQELQTETKSILKTLEDLGFCDHYKSCATTRNNSETSTTMAGAGSSQKIADDTETEDEIDEDDLDVYVRGSYQNSSPKRKT